ncbi:MAG: alpha/beta hydrolase [Microbacteriaceae bacterium]|nr:alpha/beta hydrolase [Cryobacterium sp.]MBX3103962.1 alpha/beta hydrolase [Cryobacterium sp.]MCC6376881.1 alpha/beta hydrolase [Microbacteriaceae bacterium]
MGLLKPRAPLLHVAADLGAGPVVVLIHGIASSSATFEKLVPLIDKTHRVIAIDLLGFGGSPSGAESSFTIEEHVAAFAHTVNSLKLKEPFTLVGHSMGGLIATRYATTNSRRLRKLVLVSPPIYVSPSALGDPVERAAMGLYLRAYEYLRQNKSFTMRNAAMLAKISPIKNVLEVSERNWRAFTLSLQNLIESQTTISDLAKVKVPVEIAYGRLDPFLMHDAGLRIAGQLRGVRLHKVEANDHIIRNRMARVVATCIG